MNLQVPISTRSIIFKIGTTHLKKLLDDDGLTLKMENRRINYQDLERRGTTTTQQRSGMAFAGEIFEFMIFTM